MNNFSTKFCRGCHQELPIEMFGQRWQSRSSRTVYQSRCKPCLALAAQERRQAEPDKCREINRRSYAKNPDKERERSRNYHAKNRDVVTAKMRDRYWANPEQARQRFRRNYRKNHSAMLQRVKIWRQSNPLLVKIYAAVAYNKRRDAIKATENNFSAADAQRQLLGQNYRCYWCGDKLKKANDSYIYHIDHIFALARGGRNDVGNICCSCASCNLKKNAKEPIEFAGRLF